MAYSGSRRSRLKRINDDYKSPYTESSILVNYQESTDWNTAVFNFKNDFLQCRAIATLNGLAQCVVDEHGWPETADWRIVCGDMSSDYNADVEMYPSTAEKVGQTYFRFPLNTKYPGQTTSKEEGVFPLAGYNHVAISDIVMLEDGFTFSFNITYLGQTPILRGLCGMSALYLPTPGYTVADCIEADENDDVSIFRDDYLDYYKQFSGIRFMGVQGTNEDVLYGTYYRSCWNYRSVYGVNRIQLFEKDISFWNDTFERGINIEFIIMFCNDIKKRPGNKLQKMYINFPHDTSIAWFTRYLYGSSYDETTGAYSEDTSIILADSGPDRSLGEEFVDETTQVILDTLHPSIQTYYELSNETWNYQFCSANAYLNLINSIAPKTSDDLNMARAQCKAYFTCLMSDRIKAVYAAHERVDVVPPPVIIQAGQNTNPITTMTQTVYWIEEFTGKPVADTIDALSSAPYFKCLEYDDYTIPADLHNAWINGEKGMKDELGIRGYSDRNRDDDSKVQIGLSWLAEFAKCYNLKVINYEGGIETQDCMPFASAYTYTVLAKFDDGCRNVLKTYLQLLRASGIDEQFYFNAGPRFYLKDSSFTWSLTSLAAYEWTAQLQGFREGMDTKVTSAYALDNGYAWHIMPQAVGESTILNCRNSARFSGSDASFYDLYEGVHQTEGFYQTGPVWTPFGNAKQNDCLADNESSWTANGFYEYVVFVPATGIYEFRLTVFGGKPLKATTAIGSIIDYLDGEPVLATDMIEGTTYYITTVGTTDFTLIGALSNTVNTAFVADFTNNQPSGTGTGTDVSSFVLDTAASGSAGINFFQRKSTDARNAWNFIGKYMAPGGGSTTVLYDSKEAYQVNLEYGWNIFKMKFDVPDIIYGVKSGGINRIYDVTVWDSSIELDGGKIVTTATQNMTYNDFSNHPNLTFTVETGLGYVVGDYVLVSEQDYEVFVAACKIVSYNSLTGELVVYVDNRRFISDLDPTTLNFTNFIISSVWALEGSHGAGYSNDINDLEVIIPAPHIASGIQAVGEVTSVTDGQINDIRFINSGSGYNFPVQITVRDNSVGAAVTEEANFVSCINGAIYIITDSLIRTIQTSGIMTEKEITYVSDALGNPIVTTDGEFIIDHTSDRMVQFGFGEMKVTRLPDV